MPDNPQRVTPYPGPAQSPDDGGSDLFDYAWIRDFVGFVARSVVRHRSQAIAAFLATVGLAGFGLWALPKTYLVETRILAQRNPVMSVLANPNFGRPSEADAPTRAARETVLRWENLLALVKETGLADVPLERRAPAARFREWLMTSLFQRETTREEKIEALAYALEKKLKVSVSEGVVLISVEWSDPEYAFRIAESALQNFMEARHATEISIVGEAISILQSHLSTLDQEIADLEARLGRIRVGRPQRTHRVRSADREGGAALASPEEVARLRAVYASKQRAIADLEDFRNKRLADLQAQLAQQRATYADMHPAVISTRQSIETLGGPSPQIETLRLEAQDLERELARLEEPSAGSTSARTSSALLAAPDGIDSPGEAETRGELRVRYSKRATLADRIDSARMEMDTAQAAFKYRYVVIGPPQVPKRPVRPVPLLVWTGSVLGGMLLAIFAAAAIDLRSGRVVERWQVERQLALPVLGELRK